MASVVGQCQPKSQRPALPGMGAAALESPPPDPPFAPIEGYHILILGGLLFGAKKIYDRKRDQPEKQAPQAVHPG